MNTLSQGIQDNETWLLQADNITVAIHPHRNFTYRIELYENKRKQKGEIICMNYKCLVLALTKINRNLTKELFYGKY